MTFPIKYVLRRLNLCFSSQYSDNHLERISYIYEKEFNSTHVTAIATICVVFAVNFLQHTHGHSDGFDHSHSMPIEIVQN